MACIKIIEGIKLFIYSRDHNPPHFHVYFAEYEELILIEDLTTYAGRIPAKYRKKVLNWALNNREFLKSEWKKLNP